MPLQLRACRVSYLVLAGAGPTETDRALYRARLLCFPKIATWPQRSFKLINLHLEGPLAQTHQHLPFQHHSHQQRHSSVHRPLLKNLEQ